MGRCISHPKVEIVIMDKILLIDEKDTVAVVLCDINTNQKIQLNRGKTISCITAIDHISQYHKIAIQVMRKGEEIIKYGECIGIASKDIDVGEHVHEHNIKETERNLRGGDLLGVYGIPKK